MLQRPMVGFEPKTRLFAMGVGAQTVRLWKLARGDDEQSAIGQLQTDRSGIAGLAVVDDQLVTVHETGLVAGWEIEALRSSNPEPVWSLESQLVVSEVAVARTGPGSRLMAAGGAQGDVVVCRLERGDEQPGLAGLEAAHDDQVEVLEFSGDQRRLATAGRDREIAVWSLQLDDDNQPLVEQRRLTGSGGWPLSVSFSASGRRLASGCMDNGVYFWDLEADEPLQTSRFEHHGWVEEVCWTEGDEALISGSWDNTVGIYGAGAEPRFQFMYHDDYVATVLPVADTSLVFAGSYDGDVTVWNWRDGSLEAVLEGHRDWVIGLVWLGEGRVASISSDQTARLWSVDELESVGMVGEPAISDFELGGGLDLASFGFEEDHRRLNGDSGPDLDVMQSKVVRRFESDGPASATSQDPAMSMLETALDSADGVEADEVDPGEALEEVDGDQTGVGDEISSLVRDAISETDEDEDQGAVDEDVEAAFDDVAGPGEETDDAEGAQQEAMELLDVPDIDTASADDLKGTSAPGESSPGDDGAGGSRPGSGEVEPDPETLGELKDRGGDEGEFPDVDEIAEQAFDDVRGDVDIMDSTFDSAAPGRQSGADEEAGDEDSVPTSGPDYDPQPVESGDEVSDLLPDEDELDEAFSSSVSEASGEGSEPEAETDDGGTSKERDVDRPPGDEPNPGDREESSGKAEPPSARQVRDHGADGGQDNPWNRQEAGSTSTRGKPLPARSAVVDAGDETSESELTEESAPTGPGTGVAPGDGGGDSQPDRSETLTPFTSLEDLEKSSKKAATDDEQDDGSGVSGDSLSLDRSKLEQLAERLDAEAAESGADDPEATQEEPVETEAESRGEESADESVSEVAAAQLEEDDEDETKDEFRRAVETDEIDAESVARLDRDESDSSPSTGGADGGEDEERDLRRGEAVSPVSEPDPEAPKGLKTGSARSLRMDDPVEAADEVGQRSDSDVEEAGGGLETDGEDRLMPGDSVDQEGLAIPEPEEAGESSSGDETRRHDGDAGADHESTSRDEGGPTSGTRSKAGDDGVSEAEESVPTEQFEIPAPDSQESTVAGEPEEDQTTSGIEIPKPAGGDGEDDTEWGHRQVGAEGTSAMAAVREVDWKDLWRRGRAATPKMGVLRRGGDRGDYEPATRVEVDDEGDGAVAVSDEEHRIVTGRHNGLMVLRRRDGDELYRFVTQGCQWVNVGFLEGDRFWYGLDRGGRVGAWLVPEDDGPIEYATFGSPATTCLCSGLDDDRRRLVVGTEGGVGYVWELSDGECVARLEGHDAPVTAVGFGERGPVTAGRDGTVRFWNDQGLQIDQVSTSAQVRDLAASDGTLMWVEAQGAVVRMQEGSSEVTRLQGHFGEGKAVDVTADNCWISGGDDGRMLVRGVDDEEFRQEIQVPAPVYRLAATKRRLVAVSPGGVIYLFERVEADGNGA